MEYLSAFSVLFAFGFLLCCTSSPQHDQQAEKCLPVLCARFFYFLNQFRSHPAQEVFFHMHFIRSQRFPAHSVRSCQVTGSHVLLSDGPGKNCTFLVGPCMALMEDKFRLCEKFSFTSVMRASAVFLKATSLPGYNS